MRISKKAGFYIFLACVAILLISLFWIVSTYAQEGDPGDPVLTCDINQDFQIIWQGDTDWSTVVPTSLTYAPGPVGTHSWVVWGTGEIVEPWEGLLADGITKMQVSLTTSVPESSGWWTFYSFRWRCRVYAGTVHERISPWSESSKLYVITFGIPWRAVSPGN